ncbi:MAG: hypothetical protein U9N84_14060 [Actinomycetota bacterium]|nr:hypothetical protein [Actinomycetota bacterium]
MTTNIDTAGIERRARAAAYQDGLTELFAAGVLVMIAVMWVITPVFVGIVSAFVVLYGWKVVERIKQRITYPRIGYHVERPDEPRSTASGMLGFIGGAFAVMVLAVAMFGDLTDAAEWRRAASLLSGLGLFGGFWYLGDKSGLLRHRFVAIYSVVTGVALWAIGTGASYEGVIWHLLGLAALLAALGVWGLIHFLRTNPVVNAGSDA